MFHLPRLPALLALVTPCLVACWLGFDLGVAAFEVRPDGATLWTRVVSPDPDATVLLIAEIATDPQFDQVIQQRWVRAEPESDHTVAVVMTGLQPSTQYHYRFRAAGPRTRASTTSRSGSFRTAPDAADGAPVRFVVSGDSNIGYAASNGFDFHVLSAAAGEQPDFFVYFGDTIYADSGILPGGASAVTLDEYREVHRLTRADPHLQTLLAATGTFSGWDDHEIRNDYAGQTVDPQQFEAGATAFFEYLPVTAPPGSPRFRTHRRVRWGRDVELFFLDGRQFRSEERFCNETLPDGPETAETLFSPFARDEQIAELLLPPTFFAAAEPLLLPSDEACVATLLGDPTRTLLGRAQLDWLKQSLLDSTATWKIIVNDTPLSTLLFLPYDRWEAYGAERAELLDFLGSQLDPTHTLVLTTDFHTNLVLKRAEFTELIVGPIATGTFGNSVLSRVPPELGSFAPFVLTLMNGILNIANGPPSLLGVEHDAFSYATVEIFDDLSGQSRLRVTVRGNTDFMAGANDPALVRDLFSFELP